jgi:hypothetical protein
MNSSQPSQKDHLRKLVEKCELEDSLSFQRFLLIYQSYNPLSRQLLAESEYGFAA